MSNHVNTVQLESKSAKQPGIFRKDFTLVVIGQVISLFGNAILRFALPLYILEQSNSAALFGLVSASSFLPMIFMSPIGGIVADRVNKQRIMVALDFFTTALILGFMLVMGRVALVPLVVVVLMLLYGIQGAYSPAVQASLPLLVRAEQLVSANAVVGLVQSFSGLLGPVMGGMLYGKYGLSPILMVGCGCFFFSAVMELFIRIPHTPRETQGNVWSIVRDDMAVSFRFLLKEKPVMTKVIGVVFAFNMFMSAMLVIGLPVLITQTLRMSSELYGFSQGAMAAGGLAGGIAAGALGKRLDVKRAYLLLLVCGLGLVPMGLVLLFGVHTFVSYLVITVMSFVLMVAATLFSVQMLAFVQAQTPAEIVGKVISCLMALSVCAQPIGQALYGVLFERFAAIPWVVVLGAAIASSIIAVFSKAIFNELRE